MGTMLLSKLLGSGMSPLKAYKQAALGLGDKKNRELMAPFLAGMDPLARGFLMRQEGLTESVWEGSNVNLGTMGPARTTDMTAYSEQAMALKNRTDNMYATSEFGLPAAQIGYEAQKALLNIMQENSGAIRLAAEGILAAEKTMFEWTAKSVQEMGKLITTISEFSDKISNFNIKDALTPDWMK